MAESDSTFGLCECGCGRPTNIAKSTNRAWGHVKGQPVRFLRGHLKRQRTHLHVYLKRWVNGSTKAAHIVVAEAAIGKQMPIGAQVHHVDGDKQNNRPANLVICQDAEYHMLLHARQRIVAAGGHPDVHRICGRCKALKTIPEMVASKSIGNYRCRDCQRERNRIYRSKERT
jgi:hypothetical protein